MSFERSRCLNDLISFKYFLVLFSLIFSLSFFVISCDDNGNVLSSDIGQGDSSGDTSSDTTPPDFASDPVVTMAPNPDTPLVGLLEFTADEPVRATVTISDTTLATTNSLNGSMREIVVEAEELTLDHSIMLLGFSPDKTYEVGLVVTDEAGNDTTFGQNITVTTDPLPEGFPPIEVTSSPELMEPGVTIFPVRASGANTEFGSVLVAVNGSGDVVWYKRFDNIGYGDVRRMSSGNLLFILDDRKIVEVNMLGDIVHEWISNQSDSTNPDAILVDVPYFHHEVFEMSNGNFLFLGVELRTFEDYPTSDSDPFAPLETAVIVGDVVIEFSPDDGQIVNEWSMLELLDPYRIGYGSLSPFWDNNFPEIENGTRDWTHGNAVIHDLIDDSIIVSLRNQDAVVKFSRQSGELIWILGPHENWDQDMFGSFLLDPVGEEFLFQYHQHAPQITPEGTLMIYDNGNFRASPFDTVLSATENFSRAVEYLVNENTMEVEQVWEYGQFAEPILYAPFIGDADAQPMTGNVLITHGGVTSDEEGLPSDNIGLSKTSIHIIEATRSTPSQKVFELTIMDTTPDVTSRWTTYRAERLPSLYP